MHEETVEIEIPENEAEILIDLAQKLEGSEDDQNDIRSLAVRLSDFCSNQLKWKMPPKLFLKQDSENSKDPFGKTAHYDIQRKEISIFTTGRHTKDILRSLAHELVHHHQNERGDFESCSGTQPGYAQNDKHLRKMEKEAYLVGNMLFRDWEDSCKAKKLKESKTMQNNEIKISKKLIRSLIEKVLNKRIGESKKEIKEEEIAVDDSTITSIADDLGDVAENEVHDDGEITEEAEDPVKLEENLYRERFGSRNEKVFDKLTKLWTK